MSIDGLREKKSKYQNLLINVQNVVNYIDNSSNKLGDAEYIKKNYSIDQFSAGSNLISQTRDDLNETINTLRNNVLPWIESKISSLNNQIEMAELEESTVN